MKEQYYAFRNGL